MRITNFIACEYASPGADGRVTLVGAGIDGVTAKNFPVTFNIFLFARITLEENDVPGDKIAVLNLIDEDRELVSVKIPIKMDKPNHTLVTPVTFSAKRKGSYRFNLSVAGAEGVASWPLEIRQKS